MTIEWNKVTWYSKLLALALFVALPFIGFCLGVKYQKMRDAGYEGRRILEQSKTAQDLPYNSSTISTANWKTYRNEQYGFEIRYPNDPPKVVDGYPSGGLVLIEDSRGGVHRITIGIPMTDWYLEIKPYTGGEKDSNKTYKTAGSQTLEIGSYGNHPLFQDIISTFKFTK